MMNNCEMHKKGAPCRGGVWRKIVICTTFMFLGTIFSIILVGVGVVLFSVTKIIGGASCVEFPAWLRTVSISLLPAWVVSMLAWRISIAIHERVGSVS